MKLAIIGLSQSGKATVFQALTGNPLTAGHKNERHIGTIRVPDARVDRLSTIYNPRKTIYAQVEYFLPAARGKADDKKSGQLAYWAQVRDGDALIHCVRNFNAYGAEPPQPHRGLPAARAGIDSHRSGLGRETSGATRTGPEAWQETGP